MRRAEALHAAGIVLLDVGVSGGLLGQDAGYCIMVGGPGQAVGRMQPIFTALAPEAGFAHVGPSGAGHFCEMIHNGIEYAVLQAYAEGFDLLHASDFDIDLRATAELWNHGSIIQSWLLELLARFDPRVAVSTGHQFPVVFDLAHMHLFEAASRGSPFPSPVEVDKHIADPRSLVSETSAAACATCSR